MVPARPSAISRAPTKPQIAVTAIVASSPPPVVIPTHDDSAPAPAPASIIAARLVAGPPVSAKAASSAPPASETPAATFPVATPSVSGQADADGIAQAAAPGDLRAQGPERRASRPREVGSRWAAESRAPSIIVGRWSPRPPRGRG
jgi:hypothetical protein